MKQPSGRFVIRMSGALHVRLREEGRRTGRSLNQVCVAKLQAAGPSIPGSRVEVARTGFIFPDFLEAVIRRWPEQIVGVILFGSAARGDAAEDSDIDLMLVMQPEVKITRGLYRLWEEFCQDYDGAQDCDMISPHFVSLPAGLEGAGGLWYETAIEGILLWERGLQVSRILALLRRAMGQGLIRRRTLHGSPYWIREF